MLTHYSKKPLRYEDVKSKKQKDKPDWKPVGLWVSMDGSWKEWCEAEEFSLDRLACEADIELKPDARICRIKSVEELDTFHENYKAPLFPDAPIQLGAMIGIDWKKVAKNYQGIIIAPYIWERRLEGDAHSLYYGWDVASGCIWDKNAISVIKN